MIYEDDVAAAVAVAAGGGRNRCRRDASSVQCGVCTRRSQRNRWLNNIFFFFFFFFFLFEYQHTKSSSTKNSFSTTTTTTTMTADVWTRIVCSYSRAKNRLLWEGIETPSAICRQSICIRVWLDRTTIAVAAAATYNCHDKAENNEYKVFVRTRPLKKRRRRTDAFTKDNNNKKTARIPRRIP